MDLEKIGKKRCNQQQIIAYTTYDFSRRPSRHTCGRSVGRSSFSAPAFYIQINRSPRPSYTLALVSLPQRIARSSAIMVATAPSSFSVDFSLILSTNYGIIYAWKYIMSPKKHKRYENGCKLQEIMETSH